MNLTDLIRSKIKCLKILITHSENFQSHLDGGDFSALDRFHKSRERLFEALKLYDKKIEENGSCNAEQTREVNTLIISLLGIDEKIKLILENQKSRLNQDLQQTEKEKSTIQKFKSSWVSESGIQLDGKL